MIRVRGGAMGAANTRRYGGRGANAPRPTMRKARSAAAVAIGALLVALMATYALTSLRDYADHRRQAEVLLAQLEAQANQHGALNWQAIGEEQLSQALAGQVVEVRARMAEVLSRLSWLDRGEVLGSANQALAGYQAAVSDALRLLAEGDLEGAEKAMHARVTPAFEELDAFISLASGSYGEGAERANMAVTLASALTMLSAAVLIGLVFRKLERERRTAARLDGQRRALATSEQRFRSLVQNSSDAITVTAPDGVIVYQSSSVERLLGYRATELAGTSLLNLTHPDDRVAGLAFLASAASRPHVTPPLEWRLRHRDGKWLYIETIANNLIDDPNVRGIVLNSRDLSERKALEQQLSHQALHDPLTGMPNRLLFKERLEQALVRCSGEPRRVAVLFLDLDDFKVVNDTLGHAAGDELLSAIAKRLSNGLRPDDLAARLAGDEFAVLLENHEDVTDGALAAAERLTKAVRDPFSIQGHSIAVQASIGIAVSNGAPDGHDELLRNADLAMYAAKTAGKGRYEVFHPGMHALLMERVQLEADLKAAVEEEALSLHYQPILNVNTGALEGVEALARWDRGDRGMVMPSAFIPVAEQSGLIIPMGRWVLQRACRQFGDWQSRYEGLHAATINVNVSPAQLASPTLVGDVSDAIRNAGLKPSSLVVEVTESAMVEDDQSGIATLRSLKELGVQIAVDDFGTGYSSLSHLRRFPVDVLKIDKSFLDEADVHDGTSDAVLARAVVMLARALQLVTVGEGVERREQLDLLSGLGCDLAQGNFFSPPLSPTALETLLQDGRVEPASDGNSPSERVALAPPAG